MRFIIEIINRGKSVHSHESEFINRDNFDATLCIYLDIHGVSLYKTMNPNSIIKMTTIYDDLEFSVKTYTKNEFKNWLNE